MKIALLPTLFSVTLFTSEKVVKYEVGDSTISLMVSEDINNGVTYYNMHDNETTSVEAAEPVVKKYGGRLLQLQSKGKREVRFELKGDVFEFDPNRIYSAKGVELTLKKHNNYSQEAASVLEDFSKKLTHSWIDTSKMVVALHNNDDDNFSVDSYNENGEFAADVAEIYISSQRNKFDFFYVTDKEIFDLLKQNDFNVVLQNNEAANDDGSLSVYCGKKNIPYINIEARYDHIREQHEMVIAIQDFISQMNM